MKTSVISRRDFVKIGIVASGTVGLLGCVAEGVPPDESSPSPVPPWPTEERSPLPYRFDFSVMS